MVGVIYFLFFNSLKKVLLLIYNVVLASSVPHSDSVIPIPMSILFQIIFPFRLL